MEYFDIYNENMEYIGTKLRSEVHEKGYWHKSFQCWFVFREDNKDYILFQRRHAKKDIYPNLLDTSSAGHLSAGENLADGVRELEEELGLKVRYEELKPLGIIVEQKEEDYFIDNEFANVFLYNCQIPMEEFKLQVEEVTGMFKLEIDQVFDLFEGNLKNIRAEGYELKENGEHNPISISVEVKDFVPHDLSYYKKILSSAKQYINN
jgi:isopentenyldiphosphate isomerase